MVGSGARSGISISPHCGYIDKIASPIVPPSGTRSGRADGKHKGTSTRTTFPEQEVRRVIWAAWAQLVENRAVYEMKWRATMESTEALALEKVRARQMMTLMKSARGTGRGPEGKGAGADEGVKARGWVGADEGTAGTEEDVFSEECTAAEIWESDAWIRMVLGYMIAGEREYRVGFLDGSEVRVTVGTEHPTDF